MAMRSIVTSQPDVACDVCGRRLLRGENADVFLASGERRMVCELCVSRAAHIGWLREADAHSLSAGHMRRRGPRTLLGRLRQLRDQDSGRETLRVRHDGLSERIDATTVLGEEQGHALGQLDGEGIFLGSPESGGFLDADSSAEPIFEELATSGDRKVALALAMFNTSEQPRRIAGVARSLGRPEVSVRALGESGSRVAIIVAWELCWYRYEVDLGDEAAGPQIIEQGTELDELSAEDLVGGVSVDDLGELHAVLA